MPPAARAELAARLRPREVPAGTDVIREGEKADAYYLIASGKAEVWQSRPGPPEQSLTGRLGSGDGFGEMALLLGGRRQATVRATTDLALLVLDGPSFTSVVGRHRGLALGLEEEMALRAVANFLGRSSALGRLSPEALRWLALRLQPVSFKRGREIVREGEPGNAFYIIRAGTAEVTRRLADGGETSIATLREGRAFGEQALFSDEPRSATVRATEPSELLRLTREDFDEAVARYQDLAARLARLVRVRQRPRRIDHWVIERQDGSGGEAVYIVKDTEKKRYLKLSEQGAYLWELMDGEHTVRDLALAYLKRFGAFRVDAVLESMLAFHAAGFVRIQSVGEPAAEVATETPWGRMQAALLPWVTRSFSLPDPDRALTRLHRPLRALYAPVSQVLLLLLAMAGAVLFVRDLTLGESDGLSAGAATLAVATLLAYAIHVPFHELAHALTCKHFGREVHRAGIGWYLFLPSAFVDTSDIWLSGKRPRIAVSWAGPYANVLVSGLAVVLLPFARESTVEAILFQVAVVGYVVAVLNLNPLAEFDGYYMLMDWLEIPNLRSKALGHLGALLWRTEPHARGDPRFQRIGLVYGLLTLGYTLFIALTVLTLYQKFVQGQLARALPSLAATLIGWVLAGVLASLIVQGAWSQVRAGARPQRPRTGDPSSR